MTAKISPVEEYLYKKEKMKYVRSTIYVTRKHIEKDELGNIIMRVWLRSTHPFYITEPDLMVAKVISNNDNEYYVSDCLKELEEKAMNMFAEKIIKEMEENAMMKNDNTPVPVIAIKRNDCNGICKTYYAPGMLPIVSDVKTYNNRVVKVTFLDGTTTKAVCSENDTFNLDTGITVCLIKKLLGENGHKVYNKWMKNIHERMKNNEEEHKKYIEYVAECKKKNREENEWRRLRNQKKREEQIDIITEAITKAGMTNENV